MIIANHSLGESANELVAKWPKGKYRYGFPDFYAAEFPVRPMAYDQSRIYAGVIGRHYPDAQTSRYHYLYDPNLYEQPGVPSGAGLGEISTMPTGAKIAIVAGTALAAVGVVAAVLLTRR